MQPDDPNPALPPAERAVEPEVTPVQGPGYVVGPGYVAGPAPMPVGRRNRGLGSLVLGVAIALVAILGGGSLFLSGYVLGIHQGSQPGTSSADAASFQPFWDAYHNVSERYALGPVDQQKLIDGAIKGMVEALGDPYSSYLSPEDFQNTLSDISGQFEGIGAEIGTFVLGKKEGDRYYARTATSPVYAVSARSVAEPPKVPDDFKG